MLVTFEYGTGLHPRRGRWWVNIVEIQDKIVVFIRKEFFGGEVVVDRGSQSVFIRLGRSQIAQVFQCIFQEQRCVARGCRRWY
jgi:hypothetical protein